MSPYYRGLVVLDLQNVEKNDITNIVKTLSGMTGWTNLYNIDNCWQIDFANNNGAITFGEIVKQNIYSAKEQNNIQGRVNYTMVFYAGNFKVDTV